MATPTRRQSADILMQIESATVRARVCVYTSHTLRRGGRQLWGSRPRRRWRGDGDDGDGKDDGDGDKDY
eukprot:11156831-Lingulodinium_polyedra.AAC.1